MYQVCVAEYILGTKTDQFRFLMSLRPKNWNLLENPAFKNIFNFGSVFSYLVIFHLFLIAVSYMSMFYLAICSLDKTSSIVEVIFIGVIVILIICVYIFYRLYNSYERWWKNQEWIEMFEQLTK